MAVRLHNRSSFLVECVLEIGASNSSNMFISRDGALFLIAFGGFVCGAGMSVLRCYTAVVYRVCRSSVNGVVPVWAKYICFLFAALGILAFVYFYLAQLKKKWGFRSEN